MNDQRTFNWAGWVEKDPEYRNIRLYADLESMKKDDPSTLAEQIQEFVPDGSEVLLSYFIATEKIDWDTANLVYLRKVLGDLEVDSSVDGYSEWTIMGIDEDIKVGGHSLTDEIPDNCYLLLRIEVKKTKEEREAEKIKEALESEERLKWWKEHGYGSMAMTIDIVPKDKK